MAIPYDMRVEGKEDEKVEKYSIPDQTGLKDGEPGDTLR